MNDFSGSNGHRSLAEVLREHPAVADSAVTEDTDGQDVRAWLVPDPDAATVLHRSAALEAAGRLGALSWHEPAGDVRVAGLNRTETDFLYREIFTENAYFRHGIALPPGAVVVDTGANIGMFTLCAAQRSPGARIIAVEPVTELADAVALNAELHGVDATVLRGALGRVEGESEFTFYPHNSVMSGGFADATEDLAVLKGYLTTGDEARHGAQQDTAQDAQVDRLVADRMAAERRRVPVTTLSRVARDHGLTRIDLLKIDVEKAETEVLGGIDEALWPRIDQVVMEVHDLDGRLQAVVAELRSRGFDVTHEQDPRLLLTPCHNVYARRPGAAAPGAAGISGAAAGFGGGPTLRALAAQLRELVARRLPSAAPPGQFAVVTELAPANGRTPAAAPAPAPATATAIPGASAPDPAGTSPTAVLARIWSDLFGAQAVRPDADFFDLGGDSLTAVRLMTQVEAELGEEALTPDLIFTDGTFGALAAAIEAAAHPRKTMRS